MDLSQDVRNLFEKEDVVSYLRKLQDYQLELTKDVEEVCSLTTNKCNELKEAAQTILNESPEKRLKIPFGMQDDFCLIMKKITPICLMDVKTEMKTISNAKEEMDKKRNQVNSTTENTLKQVSNVLALCHAADQLLTNK